MKHDIQGFHADNHVSGLQHVKKYLNNKCADDMEEIVPHGVSLTKPRLSQVCDENYRG